MQDALSLPDDLEACHALLVEQAAALAKLVAAREQLSQENESLNLAIQKLLARLRGHRSERSVDPAQRTLDFGDDPSVPDGLADAAAEVDEILQEFTVRRKLKKRKPRNEELQASGPAEILNFWVDTSSQSCSHASGTVAQPAGQRPTEAELYTVE